MYREYFFKNKGVLSRKFVASGLAAVFSAGMFGSYAGAMKHELNNNFNNIKTENEFSEKDKNAIETFVFLSFKKGGNVEENFSWNGFNLKNKYTIDSITAIGEDKEELEKFFIEIVKLYYKYADNGTIYYEYNSFDKLIEEYPSIKIGNMFADLISDSTELEKVTRLIEIIYGESKLKKFNKNFKVIFGIVVVLVVIIAITFAVRGNFNTGDPNNNKDDEKVNPPIDPEDGPKSGTGKSRTKIQHRA